MVSLISSHLSNTATHPDSCVCPRSGEGSFTSLEGLKSVSLQDLSEFGRTSHPDESIFDLLRTDRQKIGREEWHWRETADRWRIEGVGNEVGSHYNLTGSSPTQASVAVLWRRRRRHPTVNLTCHYWHSRDTEMLLRVVLCICTVNKTVDLITPTNKLRKWALLAINQYKHCFILIISLSVSVSVPV